MGYMTPLYPIIELHDHDKSRTLAHPVANLYHAVFSLPPFLGTEEESRSQQAYYIDMLARPGFHLVTARHHADYVGFAYGYPLPRDTQWWNGISEELPDEFTKETGTRTFVIIDFGVLPDYRGKGIGKAIHDTILTSSGAQRATLTVQPKAKETQAIYEHWAWRKIGSRPGSLAGVPVTFNVYLLEPLPNSPGTAS